MDYISSMQTIVELPEYRQRASSLLSDSEKKCPKAVVHSFSAIDVKTTRSNLNMSQTEFASAFGISVNTLRHWERGDRKPQGPALVLLNIVAKEPQAVLNALAE